MTSSEIRQSFLDFFESKRHSIVPSAPLLPDAPNLLFTNAGMNQFVPYFLGEREAPFRRAADTQKCIRAGGKHNDLEDVGFDTYHHTFFEMLGNWSFGDYFKAEAIEWAWELLTGVWGFPRERLYATVYRPGEGDPAEFDQEAHDLWKAIFEREGLDPAVHILGGGKKDNFWMMGETGPCGPCSEIHIDLTPAGDTGGKQVNADSPWCIEIWNLVFMQFNAGEDGSLSPLPARHVDTGMGFERVAGILATTRGFTDFSQPPSNYNSDLFTALFEHLSEHCGHRYGRTMPEDRARLGEAEMKDCAFRVIADHIRTLAFSIADGILPGNEGRNYVLRRILRRAVMFGKRLELPDGFFARLAPVVVDRMGDHFPELKQRAGIIGKVLSSEEATFEKTLERGMKEFVNYADSKGKAGSGRQGAGGTLSGEDAFTLYDTYGFPLDLTQLLARERGLTVDTEGFEKCMDEQRRRARAAQKKEVIRVAGARGDTPPTEFVGFDDRNLEAVTVRTLELRTGEDGSFWALFDRTPFYAEMGGQVGDTGLAQGPRHDFRVVDTRKDDHGHILHRLDSVDPGDAPEPPEALPSDLEARLFVDLARRRAIQRHHSATHLLNWALRSTLGPHVRQAGSYVGPDRLRFDFSHFENVSKQQLHEIERMVNGRVLENAPVEWYEIPYDEKPDDVVAVFGEKYGDVVRVVDIGGYSKELCGGTHVRATGEIGLVKIISESGIAAGTRRIEAACGEAAFELAGRTFDRLAALAEALKCPVAEVEEKLESLAHQRKELEKELKRMRQKASAGQADELLASAGELEGGLKLVKAVVDAPDPNELRGMATGLGKKIGEGVVLLAAAFGDKVSICATASPGAIAAGYKAGDIIRDLTAKLGGKGGGKPDFAMGGAPDEGKLDEVLKAYEPPRDS